MKRGQTVKKELINIMQAERNRGKTCGWIAEEYGLDEKTVSKLTKTPKKGTRNNKDFIIANKHLSTKELMKKTGCCASYINQTITKANIESANKEVEIFDKEYREQVKKICKEQRKLEKEKSKYYKAQLQEEKKRLKALYGGTIKVIE